MISTELEFLLCHWRAFYPHALVIQPDAELYWGLIGNLWIIGMKTQFCLLGCFESEFNVMLLDAVVVVATGSPEQGGHVRAGQNPDRTRAAKCKTL